MDTKRRRDRSRESSAIRIRVGTCRCSVELKLALNALVIQMSQPPPNLPFGPQMSIGLWLFCTYLLRSMLLQPASQPASQRSVENKAAAFSELSLSLSLSLTCNSLSLPISTLLVLHLLRLASGVSRMEPSFCCFFHSFLKWAWYGPKIWIALLSNHIR